MAILMGLCPFGRYAVRLGIPANDFCRICGSEGKEKTVFHLMWQCPVLAIWRQRFLISHFLTFLTELSATKIAAIHTYIHNWSLRRDCCNRKIYFELPKVCLPGKIDCNITVGLNAGLMVFSFLQRRSHPLTKCIKKIVTSPAIIYFFIWEGQNTNIKKVYACVYHLLRSVARSLLFLTLNFERLFL